LKGYRIDRIVNTHSHEDHIAGNAALQKMYDVDVLAHPMAIPVLANPKMRQPLHLYQQLMWGYPAPSRGKAIGDFIETDHHRFEVIHTPGHSPDHICLYEPEEGWLFSGDLFVGGRDRALRADYNIWLIITSLKKVSALDIRILFPGSGTVRRTRAMRSLTRLSI
jgi:glyoxylase-like metal-dependent hydrolase (beta-lactamase superfamily II)